MKHILIVDDEPDVLDLLRYNLQKDGFRVSEAANGLQALALTRGERPDLIVLDLMLPEMDGFGVFRALRADSETAGIPIIMLTAKGDQGDTIAGLELGADDYMSKPFSPKELVLRAHAILRRAEVRPSTDVLEYEGFRLDKGALAFYLEGQRVDLTPIEFRLLVLLLEKRGKIFTREELLEKVWGYSVAAQTRTVDTSITRLRTKLGPHSARIETIRSEGYRFSTK